MNTPGWAVKKLRNARKERKAHIIGNTNVIVRFVLGRKIKKFDFS